MSPTGRFSSGWEAFNAQGPCGRYTMLMCSPAAVGLVIAVVKRFPSDNDYACVLTANGAGWMLQHLLTIHR